MRVKIISGSNLHNLTAAILKYFTVYKLKIRVFRRSLFSCRLTIISPSSFVDNFELRSSVHRHTDKLYHLHQLRVATSLGGKNQGLFKDIQVRFQDLFQRRFTAMWGLRAY